MSSLIFSTDFCVACFYKYTEEELEDMNSKRFHYICTTCFVADTDPFLDKYGQCRRCFYDKMDLFTLKSAAKRTDSSTDAVPKRNEHGSE